MPTPDETTRWRPADVIAAAVIVLIAGAVVYVLGEQLLARRNPRGPALPDPALHAEMQRNAEVWDRRRDELDRQARARARQLVGRWQSEGARLEITETTLTVVPHAGKKVAGSYRAGRSDLHLFLSDGQPLRCPYRLAGHTLELSVRDEPQVFVRED